MIREDLQSAPPSKRSSLVLKAVLLVIHIIFGILGFIFFAYHMNIRAGSGCMSLAMVCAWYLYLNCDVMKGNLHESYSFSRYKFFFILSIVMGFLELGWSSIYVFLAAVYKQGFHFSHDMPSYFDAIPSSMACLWSFLLAYQCKSYMRELSTDGVAETGNTSTLWT